MITKERECLHLEEHQQSMLNLGRRSHKAWMTENGEHNVRQEKIEQNI